MQHGAAVSGRPALLARASAGAARRQHPQAGAGAGQVQAAGRSAQFPSNMSVSSAAGSVLCCCVIKPA